MSLLSSTLQTLVVQLRDMSGNVTQQKLHNRVFDAYEAKELVFEALTPQQHAVMLQNGGVVPPAHPAGQPVLVDSWSELVALHKDTNLYRLMPRRARTNMSYNVLRGICSSAGSPFTMENRVDPVDYKLAFRASDLEVRHQFNSVNEDKIPVSIWFDGILKTNTVSALVSCAPTLSPMSVTSLSGTRLFLDQWSRQPADGDRFRQTKELYMELLSKPTMLFLGTNTMPGRELLNLAKSKNVFVYVRKGMQYVYHP